MVCEATLWERLDVVLTRMVLWMLLFGTSMVALAAVPGLGEVSFYGIALSPLLGFFVAARRSRRTYVVGPDWIAVRRGVSGPWQRNRCVTRSDVTVRHLVHVRRETLGEALTGLDGLTSQRTRVALELRSGGARRGVVVANGTLRRCGELRRAVAESLEMTARVRGSGR